MRAMCGAAFEEGLLTRCYRLELLGKTKKIGRTFPISTAFEDLIGSSRTEKQVQGVLKNLLERLQELRADRTINDAMIA